MYSLKRITPVMTSDLVRFGRKEDGGYVVNKRIVDSTNLLLSFGINADWSFENDFYQYKKEKELEIKAYDFSIDEAFFFKTAFKLFKQAWKPLQPVYFLFAAHYVRLGMSFRNFFKKRNIKFFKKGIDSETSDLFVKFENIFSNVSPKNDSVFVKMDIEGYEFKVLEQMLEYAEKINGFVVEFHDLDLKYNDFDQLILKTREMGYVITHVHPNNSAGVIKGTNHPRLLEITFGKASLFTDDELTQPNTLKYPIEGLDYRCIRSIPELTLKLDNEIGQKDD